MDNPINDKYNEHVRTLTEKLNKPLDRTPFFERIKHIVIDVHKYALMTQGEYNSIENPEVRHSIYHIVVDKSQLADVDKKDISAIEIELGMWLMHESIQEMKLEEDDEVEFAFLLKDGAQNPAAPFDSAAFPPQIPLVELYKYYDSMTEPMLPEELTQTIDECATHVTALEIAKDTKNPENN